MATEDQKIRTAKLKEAFVKAMTAAGDNEFAEDWAERKAEIEPKVDAIAMCLVEGFDILMGKA